jgi:hypothetical protein
MPKVRSRTTASGKTADPSESEAKAQLDSFLAKYEAEIAAFARRAHVQMRQLVPGAIEMVYDNYNALVVGFGPSERASEAIFSLVLYPRYVSLCFLQGAAMPDPAKRLQGSGNVVRFIRLYDAGQPDPNTLDDAQVRDLMKVALDRAKVPMVKGARGKLVIKSISAKQRARRPAKK